MTIKFGMVMDPIKTIENIHNESSIAILHEAQSRGHENYYMAHNDLFVQDGKAFAHGYKITVNKDIKNPYILSDAEIIDLSKLDIISIRKNPPVDSAFIYMTQILDLAERAGVFVTNKPQGLRDANEKLFATWFPQCMPPTFVSSQAESLKEFLKEHKKVIIKELDSLCGRGIFYLHEHDFNADIILKRSTQNNQMPIMAQKFIPEISNGDKRLYLIDGKPVPCAMVRLPIENDIHGNVEAGATCTKGEITKRDLWLCEQIEPTLKEKGLLFVGIDIIGGYITEINVTSPGCIIETEELTGVEILKPLLDAMEKHL